MAAPRVRDGASGATSGNSASISISPTAGGAQVGDLRIVVLRVSSSANPGVPSGWARLANQAAADGTGSVVWVIGRVMAASDTTTQTVTFASNSVATVQLLAVYDHAVTSAADVVAASSGSAGASSSFPAPSVTPKAGAPSLLLTVHSAHLESGSGLNPATFTMNVPDGMTQVLYTFRSAVPSYNNLVCSRDVGGGIATGAQLSTSNVNAVNPRGVSLAIIGAPQPSGGQWWALLNG